MPIEDVGDKKNKRPRTREAVRRSPRTNKRALTVPLNRSTNKDKLWSRLRELLNLEEFSKRTLDAPVPVVMVRELLCISPHLIQQWFGIKRGLPINKDKAEPQINLAKWNDPQKKLYACVSPKCLGIIDD